MTDGTVGAAGHLGAPQTLSGSDLKITQDMGTTKGGNVFQSFKEFNIGSGQTVTFTENSAGFINNVIARVTGKETSNINGTLRVTPEGHANFYLLNPNGVLFGSGAHIDVPGDFHVTTAHFIKFQDGAKYGANPVHSELSRTEPASFGFTASTHSNNVLIDVTDGAQLRNPVTPNTAIDLVAQNIKIENGATVSANDVRLVAAKGDTSVPLKEGNGNLVLPKFAPTAENAGKVQIIGSDPSNYSPTTTVTSSADGGGRVAIWGGGVKVSNGGMIDSVQIGSSAPSLNNGVTIKASNLRMENGGRIQSNILQNASANGSKISITSSGNIDILSGSSVRANAGFSNQNLSGGEIYIKSNHAVVLNGDKAPIVCISNCDENGEPTADSLMVPQLNGIFLENSNARITSRSISLIQSSISGINKHNKSIHSSTHPAEAVSLKLSAAGEIYLRDSSIEDHFAGNHDNAGGIVRLNAGSLHVDSSIQGSPGINGISSVSGINPRIYIYTKGDIVLSGGVSVDAFTSTMQGGSIAINSGGGLSITGRPSVDSSISTTSIKSDQGKSPLAGEISISSLYTYLDDGYIAVSASGHGGSINLGPNLFAAGNVLNYKLFVSDGNIPPYTKGGVGHFNNGNNIVIENGQGDSTNVSISGALLNLSGAMMNLPPANFQSKEIANSCEVANTGSLSLTGKGRKASSGLDRLIYGY